jgi:catechol 2,3-dioxygenase-like lactoylglutathione lyase family enzyme
MLNKIEHVAIAVDDLDAAVSHYSDVWGLEVSHRERVSDQGVEEVMLRLGDSYLNYLGRRIPTPRSAGFSNAGGRGCTTSPTRWTTSRRRLPHSSPMALK